MWRKGQEGIREFIQNRDKPLWHRIEYLWEMAERRLHDAQISKYDHAQGTPHCRRVEQNLGVLIPDEWKGKKVSTLELYILSSAAALHDSGKRQSTSGDHGKVAAEAIADRPEIFGLDPPEADAVKYVVGVHNNRRLEEVPESLSIGVETVHLRNLAAIFCLADTLHCDYTRVLKPLTEEEETKIAKDPLTVFRLRTRGFDIDVHGRIWLDTYPQELTEKPIIEEGFRRMLEEMRLILLTLKNAGYPYEISLHMDGGDFRQGEGESGKHAVDEHQYGESFDSRLFLPDFGLLEPSTALCVFENKLRLFIQTSLERLFGEKWWNIRIPQDVQETCKTRKEEREGAPGCSATWPLIDYTNFLDYVKILTKRDNWKEAFREYFKSEEWLRVKLEELNPIRTDVAHNREVNPHDLRKLRDCVTEILKCITNRISQTNDTELATKLAMLHRASTSVMEEQASPGVQVDLPTAEYVLSKDKSKIPDFFKKEPEWVDFQEGYIVENEKVDAIIQNLELNPIQMVLGAPASGKSVMLKNIAFKLAKQGWKVYFIELKKYSDELIRTYARNLLTIDYDKALTVVDDAHLDLPLCEDLVRNFKLKNLRSKLLIGSRKIEELQEEHPKEVSPLHNLMKTEIAPGEAAEKIISLFLERKYGLGSKEVEDAARSFACYKQDLWFLSWALASYSISKNEVRQSDIYRKAMKSIKSVVATRGKATINAEDVLLPLSTLYRFEIAVERAFIEKQLEIKSDLLDQLIATGEIASTVRLGEKETLRLSHSSLAELYFETYQLYPDLGGRIKELVQCRFAKWDRGLLHLYLESKPERTVSILARLSQAYKNGFSKDDLILELLSDDQTKKSIFEEILGRIQNASRLNDVLAKVSDRTFSKLFLAYVSEDYLLELWMNSKLSQIGLFVGWRGYYAPSVRSAYNRFCMESCLSSKMNRATLDEVRIFIHGISKVRFRADPLMGQKLARNAANMLCELRNLSEKVKKADITTIRLLIKDMADIDGNPRFIINQIKPPFDLGAKLSEASLNDMNMLIASLSRANADLGFVLDCIRRSDWSQLTRKIDASPLQHVDHFVTNIKKADVGLYNSVLEQLEQLNLETKLSESDLKSLGSFLWNISRKPSLSAKVAAFIDDLDLTEKIGETDLLTVNYFLWNLFQVSPVLPRTFIDDNVRTMLVNRVVQKEESLGEKLRCIGIFYRAGFMILEKRNDGAPAIEILQSQLTDWLKNSFESPFKIALALNGFKAFDEDAALSFVSSCPVLDSIVHCLKGATSESTQSEELIASTLGWLTRAPA